jgi:hypothetical protein
MKAVELAWFEVAIGSEVGRLRQLNAMKKGSKPSHSYNREPWADHINGACGELAVAKALGIYFPGSVGTYGQPDLPHQIQVKTRSEHWQELALRETDNSQHRYVLVTGKAPSFRLVGWAQGNQFRIPQYRKYMDENRPPAWVIPHEALWPISSLVEVIQVEINAINKRHLEGAK